MSDGKWSGSTPNRTWVRPGSRLRGVDGDEERAPRLAEMLADEAFLCEICERKHPLREHRTCRGRTAAAVIAWVALAAVVVGVMWLALNASAAATP